MKVIKLIKLLKNHYVLKKINKTFYFEAITLNLFLFLTNVKHEM